MTDAESALEKRHPIQVAARRAGLTPHVLRAWEKRYGAAVAPERSEGGRRLYSDADVERLRLLRAATAAGRRIGDIAALPTAELHDLVEEDAEETAAGSVSHLSLSRDDPVAAIRRDAVEAVLGFDGNRLGRILDMAQLRLPSVTYLDSLIAPLLTRVGELWASGEISPSQEHVASAVIRSGLIRMMARLGGDASAPSLVVATAPGERHDLGAGLVAAAAAAEGWRVTFLGADLPPDDVALAVRRLGVDLVAVSLVYPENDPSVHEQLHVLRATLPTGLEIVVGGRAAASYVTTLRQIDATLLNDLAAFRAVLHAVAAARAATTAPGRSAP